MLHTMHHVRVPTRTACCNRYTAQVDNPPQLVAALKKAVASRSGAYIEARMLGPVPPALSQDIIDQVRMPLAAGAARRVADGARLTCC